MIGVDEYTILLNGENEAAILLRVAQVNLWIKHRRQLGVLSLWSSEPSE